MAEPKSELQRILKGTGIAVADVRTAVAVLAATAKGKTGHAVSQTGAGVAISAPSPLASSEDVQHLAESLKAVEAQLRKLEEVMAARRPNARTVSNRLISFEHEHGVAAIDPVVVLAVEDTEDGKTMVRCSAGEGQAFKPVELSSVRGSEVRAGRDDPSDAVAVGV